MSSYTVAWGAVCVNGIKVHYYGMSQTLLSHFTSAPPQQMSRTNSLMQWMVRAAIMARKKTIL